MEIQDKIMQDNQPAVSRQICKPIRGSFKRFIFLLLPVTVVLLGVIFFAQHSWKNIAVIVVVFIVLAIPCLFVILQLRSRLTEHKQAELKYQTLYESSFDAIMLLDEKGFFDCNNMTVRIFRCKDKAAFCSMHTADISPATQPCGTDSKTLANERIATAMEKGSCHFEWVHQTVDGIEFPADVLLSAMELNGKKVLQSTVRDVSEHKHAEESLRQAKIDAEAASEAKSEFLANMSHEIRTPMNAVIGFSDILADEDLTDHQKEYVNMIRNSGKHLLQVINDILDFSKIEAGKLDVKMAECSLKQLFAAVESIMQPFATKKGLKFGIQEDSCLPGNILTDSERLRQCLINLINNAIKFTETGHVYVNVSLEDKDNKPFIRFDVEDTGIGIPSEKQKKVFESFGQADGSTSRKYGGTGLGLAITKQLAELLGGVLALTSEEGKGSIFSLVIPAGIDITKQPLLDRHNIAGHTNNDNGISEQPEITGHVLVAEDVETNAILAKSLLKRFGLEVTIARDGNESVEKALSQEFDLILMDIQMPNMNGYDATKALRKEGIETPIIALTANAMSGDEGKCICAGCDDYLAKPIDRRELLDKLRKYLPSDRQALNKTIDSAKSQVDELTDICSNQVVQESDLRDKVDTEESRGIINWDQLIDRLDDEELIKEIMPTYLADSKEHFDKLTQAIKAGNAEEINRHAHAIKGAARNVGAKQLSDIASRLESAGREDDIETATKIFDELKPEFEKVISFLSQPDWIQTAKNNDGQTGKKNRPLVNNLNKHM